MVQRVLSASVTVDGTLHALLGPGLLVLLAVAPGDTAEEIQWMSRKIANLRIFDDEAGKMNRSVKDCSGELLVVSQFTLYADTSRGNRPGFTGSAAADLARPMFDSFVEAMREQVSRPVMTGKFGEHMQISLVNDGPVTLIIDSPQAL